TVAMVSQEAYDADPQRATMLPAPPGAVQRQLPSAAVRDRTASPVLHTLGNGLRIMVQPMPGTGTITMQAFSHGGLRHETAATNGRFHALARTFVRGTPDRDARAITDAFDALGGTIGGGAGNHTVGLAARCLAGGDRLARGLEVFCDVLRNATFPDAEVARALERQRLLVQRQDESWQQETMRRLRALMFGDHPYGLTLTGTEESVAQITPASLRDLHREWCAPDRTVVTIVGDLDADAALTAATRWLDTWPAGPKAGEPVVAPRAVVPDAPRHMPFPTGKQMAAIALAWAAPSWGTADAPVLDVIDAVTSGVHLPAGWLHHALRGGSNDFVYYVHAVPFAGLDGGMFYALTQCHPSQREQVLGIVRRELGRLHTEDVTADELESARHTCRIARAIDNQTNDSRAAELALDVLYNKGLGWSDAYADRIAAVTAADVRRVAAEWFRHDVLVEAIPVGELPPME
ncbi:MAG: M16 family metallopeptidase, partial [Planctomycetota bacterium]